MLGQMPPSRQRRLAQLRPAVIEQPEQPFRIEDLPAELRVMIFERLVPLTTLIRSNKSRFGMKLPDHHIQPAPPVLPGMSFLLMNHQIYNEAIEVLYGRQTFEAYISPKCVEYCLNSFNPSRVSEDHASVPSPPFFKFARNISLTIHVPMFMASYTGPPNGLVARYSPKNNHKMDGFDAKDNVRWFFDKLKDVKKLNRLSIEVIWVREGRFYNTPQDLKDMYTDMSSLTSLLEPATNTLRNVTHVEINVKHFNRADKETGYERVREGPKPLEDRMKYPIVEWESARRGGGTTLEPVWEWENRKTNIAAATADIEQMLRGTSPTINFQPSPVFRIIPRLIEYWSKFQNDSVYGNIMDSLWRARRYAELRDEQKFNVARKQMAQTWIQACTSSLGRLTLDADAEILKQTIVEEDKVNLEEKIKGNNAMAEEEAELMKDEELTNEYEKRNILWRREALVLKWENIENQEEQRTLAETSQCNSGT
ncbi:hypothetical protein K402DRAFT_400167 [Aulographum hederae CBS 113979]|uniref:F-box domain-containing protein n=1 Tax=Aulographum hederae CBS 113979 TaxID=1176131 RepID=A0A6G1HE34_9PEZI|nr:hypothetical protein K402DRAFT_400167 [Aulographum hederae CBS 113979]